MTILKKIAVVKSKYKKGKVFDEESLIANTMSNAPESYHDTLTQELLQKGDAVTLEDLKKAMKLRWRLKHGNEDDNNDNENGETAMGATDKERCDRCGKLGHDAANFWANLTKSQLKNKNLNGNSYKKKGNKSQKNKYRNKCNICHKKGHKEADCWHNEDNASKRPPW